MTNTQTIDFVNPDIFLSTEKELLAQMLTRHFRYTNTSLSLEERREIALKKTGEAYKFPRFIYQDNEVKLLGWTVEWGPKLDKVGESLEAANINIKVRIDEPDDNARVMMLDAEFIGTYNGCLYYLHRMPMLGGYQVIGVGGKLHGPMGDNDTVTIATFKESDSPVHCRSHTNEAAWEMANAFLSCLDNTYTDLSNK